MVVLVIVIAQVKGTAKATEREVLMGLRGATEEDERKGVVVGVRVRVRGGAGRSFKLREGPHCACF